MKQAQVDAWYTEGPSASPDIRLLDEIIFTHTFRACSECGWQRTRPEFEVWTLVDEPEVLNDGGEPTDPYTTCFLACESCAKNFLKKEPGTVMIRPLTRLAAVVTEEDP